MSIYFGNDTVNDLYIGLTPVSKGYVGTHLFYDGDNTIIDLTYEKYILNTQFNTLYNTAEKPVKSAILKGNTLKKDAFVKWATNYGSNTVCPIYHDGSINRSYKVYANKSYTVIRRGIWENVNYSFFSDTNGYIQGDIKSKTFIPNIDGYIQIFVNGGEELRTEDNYKNFIVIEGEVDENISYFEGMQSVKMPVLTTTGKNLFEPSCIPYNGSEYNDFKKPFATTIKPVLSLKPNTTYCISGEIVQVPKRNAAFKFVDGDGVEIQGTYVSMNNTNGSDYKTITINGKFTTKTDGNVYFNTFPAYSQEDLDMLKSSFLTSQIQIEEGTTPTTYEPYKSNILTVNEDVELRGIGDVKDELNLLTGELTERVVEIVLDGSEDWIAEEVRFKLYRDDIVPNKWSNGLSNHFIGNRGQLTTGADYDNYFAVNGYGSYLFVRDIDLFPTPRTQINEFKTWLNERNIQGNPVILQYASATGSIKTVDLSVVDQDGDNTKLSTFDDLTHVTLSSEGLVPEAELEVATKNEEVLNTMSLEMDDISKTQNALKETSNTQSENVDATMIATTEIYEQLL